MLYYADIISQRGTWVRIEIDKDKKLWLSTKTESRISFFEFLKDIGFNKKFILEYFFELNSQINNIDFSLKNDKFLFKTFFNPITYNLGFIGRKKLNKKLGLSIYNETLTPLDFLAIGDYLLQLTDNLGYLDDIDNLKNRRIRTIADLIANQFQQGLQRFRNLIFEKKIKKRKIHINSLLDFKPINSSFRELFVGNQLSQFLDQTNPLAELTHKRRFSALGSGGVNRDTAGMEIRGIHPTHYGRICPIETPEGHNAGLVNSITMTTEINKDGFFESPYRSVYKGQIQYHKNLLFITAEHEESKSIVFGDIPFCEFKFLKNQNLPVLFNQELQKIKKNEIDLISVSHLQFISLGTALIPFIEHDDANRALMGSNMQRQAIPLISLEEPLVTTYAANRLIHDSQLVPICKKSGFIIYSSNKKISCYSLELKKINFFLKNLKFYKNIYFYKKNYNKFNYLKNYFTINKINLKKNNLYLKKLKSCYNKNLNNYYLENLKKSNQNTSLFQKPIHGLYNWIQKGDIIADCAASIKGQLAIGKNLFVAYMSWEGYNFEDAIIINQKLIYKSIYNSLHIEKFEIEIFNTPEGPEETTFEISSLDTSEIINLNQYGVITKGIWVSEGDILVGKITPLPKKTLLYHEKLLYDILGTKKSFIKENSLRVPIGFSGRIIKIRYSKNFFKNKLSNGESKKVQIYIAQKRGLKIGDKMSGRHGNKGIISKIIPEQDMPYLINGNSMDILLNPLGVPSRMNVGQIFESILGFIGSNLNQKFKVFCFDEMYGYEASRSYIYQQLLECSKKNSKKWLFSKKYPSKMPLFDGRSGAIFEQSILIGKPYIMKLIHIVDEKMHVRSTGPYSLITQQPLRGRAKNGGQRFGEMEVWALEGFGIAYILQELLTIKSDDLSGRNEIFETIIKNKSIKFGIPESFKVVLRELQCLCLNVEIFDIYI
uniref:DNA-directed RNA polymerase subunit beta n=1 Tax=Dichotomosiphon tuberosus TaxID=118263 RepID=A0A386AWM5_9CHLO|nr:RNA polymerase b-subunit [Dichotomosiphon tuberosus]